jgi:hypothetical protein
VDDPVVHSLIYTVQERYSKELPVSAIKTVVVHPGPRHWKTVSLLRFRHSTTGELRRVELRAQTWEKIPSEQGDQHNFGKSDYRWGCEGEEEVEAVRLLLNEEFTTSGRYQLVQKGSEFGRLIELLSGGEMATSDVVQLVQLVGRTPDLVKALAASKGGGLLAEAVELQRRRDQLAELKRIVEDPNSTERAHIHPQLKRMGWIFGGRYIGESTRSQLSTGDVLDIPLLRADGSLHVVELKGANIPGLVQRYRGATRPQVVAGRREELPLIVGTQVHEAVGQAMNYLCHLDEDRDHILARFKIDVRRTSATVLIGHPKFVPNSFSADEIASTLRIHNSHHARIEVMHYGDLIENAERALALIESPIDDAAPDVETGDDPFRVTDHPGESAPWRDTNLASAGYSDEPPF